MRKPKKGKVVATCAVLLVALCLHLFASGKTTQNCSADDIYLSNCYSSDNSKIEVLPDNLGGFYIFSADTANTKLSYFDGNAVTPFPTLDFKYTSAASDKNNIYMSEVNENNETTIHKYMKDNDSIKPDSNGDFSFGKNLVENFTVGNDVIFFLDGKNLFGIYESTTAIITENCKQFAVNFSRDKLYIQTDDDSVKYCSIDNT